MEDYAEELRTPPVTLVSLVGFPEIHQTISTFLHSEQPPINTLALPDFSKISIMAKKHKEAGDSGQPASGILKKDWLAKHRTRVPAIVAAVFGSDRVNGDPAQWLQVCTDLDNVKTVVQGRNTKLVVMLVQTTDKDEVTEDLLIALRKRAEIDPKYLIVFGQRDAAEQKQSLNRLAGIFAELSNTYYREEGRRIKFRMEKKSFNSIELNIRYSFKVAVYAEFRRDWAEALKFYEEAYRALREMVGTSTRLPPVQRLVEIKAVSEQLHFKISTLLLHGGKVVEAVTWFRKHIASYERLVGVPEIAFLHWEWLSRQFLVFAELLETSAAAIPNTVSPRFGTQDNPLTAWEFQPAYYYQLSASYLKEKRCCLERSLSMSDCSEIANTVVSTPESVVQSVFVGQFSRLLEQGEALALLPLTDAEYTRYALSEGKRFPDSFEIIALFKKSFEAFNILKAPRMASYCCNKMAREYFAVGDFSNAKQLFDGVSSLYRQEGWVTLLWESLSFLRECSWKLGSTKDFIEYSLEMSALPIFSSGTVKAPTVKGEYGPAGSACLPQREIIQEEVFRLLKGESDAVPSDSGYALGIREDQPVCVEVDLISPLRAVFLATVAFHDQTVKPGMSTLLTVSLLSQLPLPVMVDQLEIQFNQPACNFLIKSAEERPSASKSFVEEQGPHLQTAPDLLLATNKWLRLTYEIKSGESGKLECLSVTAKMGPHFMICCRAESPASMGDLPLWKFEDRMETFPTKDPGLSFSGQKVIQVEEPEPLMDLILDAAGPALVGEIFAVPVLVVSKGHAVRSGELKINIVDARGSGLMSPREIEPSSSDSPHVELLGVSGLAEEDECQNDPENIKKIQQSFGLVSIPDIEVKKSWSCKLELKWHKPKSIMLYVSLGYYPSSTESASQRVNVHKSLQIEGKTPVIFSHCFMMPFRRDPLLISKIKPPPDSDQMVSLAQGERSVLIVSARNCCEVPLRLISMSIEPDDEDAPNLCTVKHSIGSSSSTELDLLVPGEEFKRVFAVTPHVDSPNLGVGSVHLKWVRDSKIEEQSVLGVLVKHKLPHVNVEKPPLVVSFEIPPHAVLGVPFMFHVRVQNLTCLLQEIRYSLGDSQSFVFSGPHNDVAFILPKSEHLIHYKLVPLSSGSQQLPLITITSVRYSAGFHPSMVASTMFVFPSRPHFDLESGNKGSEAISTR